jgi:hypothetical protein
MMTKLPLLITEIFLTCSFAVLAASHKKLRRSKILARRRNELLLDLLLR